MQTGQKIRDYVLERKLGEGGMGEVWSAVHSMIGRRVAIKAVWPHLAADREFRERFLQEARAHAALEHPRILRLSDFFVENGIYYIVMDLLEGETLSERLERVHGLLPRKKVLSLARDLLAALNYAHQKGIIHRDVKPANVLIGQEGHAYLTDFGIALLMGQQRLTRTGTSVGTPYYMSPEQIRSPKKLDHRADVYSVGCVIYEMLAGRPPFLPESEDGDTDFELKEAHLYDEPKPIRHWNAQVPAELDAVILRALAKDPDQRYGGCGEFRRALDEWDRSQAGGQIPKSPPKPAHPPTPPPPKRAPSPLPKPAPPPVSPSSKVSSVQVQVPPQPSAARVIFFVAIGCLSLLALFFIIAYANGNRETAAETPTAETPTDSVRSEEDMFLLLVSKNSDLTKDWDDFATLAPGTSRDVSVRMIAGITYVLDAVCDSNCQYINLELYDLKGKILAKETLPGNTSRLNITLSRSAALNLRVSMVRCDAQVCSYMVGLFRPAKEPWRS